MLKYTPGPWTLAMDTGDQVAMLGNKEHSLVCTVSKGCQRPHGEGNARLIVKLPEIVDFVRSIAEFDEYILDGEPSRAILARIEHRARMLMHQI